MCKPHSGTPRYHITAPPGAKVAQVACSDCGIAHGYVGMDALIETLGARAVLDGSTPGVSVHVPGEVLSALRSTDTPRPTPRR